MGRREATLFVPSTTAREVATRGVSEEAASVEGPPETDGGLTAPLMVVSAVALGAALQIRDGLFQPWAMLWLTVAIAACVASFLIPRSFRARSAGSRWLTILLAVGLALEFLQLLFHELPGSWHGVDADWRFQFAILCAAALAAGIVVLPQHARTCFWLLIATFMLTGIWIIRNVPAPYMDVWMVQTQSVRAFHLRGVNPYAAVYPDIYNRPDLYAEGAITGGLVHQGYPYPPVAFWMSLAGYSLFGDFRYASLAAMAATAVLIGVSRPGGASLLAGALFLFTPRVFFVLESGWTEPFSALLLAAVVFLASRVKWGAWDRAAEPEDRPGPTPMPLAVVLGLFLASKQYLIFAAPLALMLVGRPLQKRRVWRFAGAAFLSGCAVSLPLVLWNAKAFLQSTAGFAGAAEFRTDALNYMALFADLTGRIPTASLASFCGLTTAILGVMLALYRGPRTPAGYAASVALVYYLFFAFYKFAFCNYYYLILAACCSAVGASGDGRLPHGVPKHEIVAEYL